MFSYVLRPVRRPETGAACVGGEVDSIFGFAVFLPPTVILRPLI